jgi:hypothetical protein
MGHEEVGGFPYSDLAQSEARIPLKGYFRNV